MKRDPALTEALERLVPEPRREPEWVRVLADAYAVEQAPAPQNPIRRRIAVAVALAFVTVAALAATPATGLRGAVVDLFSEGEKAPSRVVRDFESLDSGAPAGMAPGVRSGETRRVATFTLSDGRSVPLWVAPAKAGTFCLEFHNLFGGCTSRRFPVSVTTMTPGTNGPFLLGGSVLRETGAARLQVEFADGTKRDVPVVWVSKPINAGFYLYEVPRSNWGLDQWPTRLVATNADGGEAASGDVPGRPVNHLPGEGQR